MLAGQSDPLLSQQQQQQHTRLPQPPGQVPFLLLAELCCCTSTSAWIYWICHVVWACCHAAPPGSALQRGG